MIGVVARPTEHPVIQEFFELFKTQWEFVKAGRRYEAVISDGSSSSADIRAIVVLVYSADFVLQVDIGGRMAGKQGGRRLACQGLIAPIYGGCVLFPNRAAGPIVDAENQMPASYVEKSANSTVVRVGYDLFSEVRTLLSVGQPLAQAEIPSVDVHIAIMRQLLLTHGVSIAEIPPVPEGYKYIACLTHDVDHPSIRRHKGDHTMMGFLYRAVIRSWVNVVRSRCSLKTLLRNCWAACRLPLVYLGVAQDFWLEFDRYLDLEGGRRSTFFVIPFKGVPGRRGEQSAPSRRAAAYDLADIERPLGKLRRAKCEIALHGLDAWHDVPHGRREVERVRGLGGGNEHGIGVRMHWLYFDEQAPSNLERAGASYDSSVGFNETVGYRAGTTQVYKPLQAIDLLELPLHVMDTALFFSGHLNLTQQDAMERVRQLIANAVQFGGCITINWHDRSIFPERCWDRFYGQMISELERSGAWLATAGEVVSWFRTRRAIRLMEADAVTLEDVSSGVIEGSNMPGLQWCVHHPQQ